MLVGAMRRALPSVVFTGQQHAAVLASSALRGPVGSTEVLCTGDASDQPNEGIAQQSLLSGLRLPKGVLHFSTRSYEDKQQHQLQQPVSLKYPWAMQRPALGPNTLQQPALLLPFAIRGNTAGALLSPNHTALLSTISARPRCMSPAQRVIGLGLGLTPRMPKAAVQLQAGRPYGNEGELFASTFLLTTDLMFWAGLTGAVIFRRNLIVMLLTTEIVMLACNLNFLFASAYLNDMTGVIFSLTITTIAACETAIGLALCVSYFHIRSTTDVEALNLLK